MRETTRAQLAGEEDICGARLLLAGALLLGGCSENTAGPDDQDLFSVTGFGMGGGGMFGVDMRGHGMGGADGGYLRHLNRLPDSLKLSDAQKAAIAGAVSEFTTATQADRDALHAIMQEARAAARAGKSRDEVKAITDKALPILERLEAAEDALRAKVDSILTAEQRAWLASHSNRPCSPAELNLTDAQKAQIQALVTAFETANKADLDALRAAHEQAAAARRNGATREQIRAILEAVRPAAERVRAAAAQLHEDILAQLTAEQKATGCFPGRMRGR